MKNPALGEGERDRGRCPHLSASTPSFARPLAPRSLPGPRLSHQLVVEHMSQLAESELDGSPNKGPKKQLKVLNKNPPSRVHLFASHSCQMSLLSLMPPSFSYFVNP